MSESEPETTATTERPGRHRLFGPTVGVPRRFGLSHLMLFTSLLALLLGLLSWGGVDAASLIIFTVFFLGVGASQAILYDGKRPREASALIGAVLAPTLVLVAAAVFPDDDSRQFIESQFFVIAGSPLLFVSGAPLGYVFGGLIAGVFLIRDRDLEKVESTISKPKTDTDPPETVAEEGGI